MTDTAPARWANDNRWSSGGLADKVPAEAVAAYGARWIDMGDTHAADIVPDRQGFAYNHIVERDALISFLERLDARTLHHGVNRDVEAHVADEGRFQLWLRRAGGYVYVAAWLLP